MVLVEIISCILRTSSIWSSLYLRASGIIADLVIFYGVDLRVTAAWDMISSHISIRFSAVVLECLFLDRNVLGILTSCMVYTCSSAKYTCCVVFYFENISASICAAIMSDLHFLSLLLTASDISCFLSLYTVNIAYARVAVTALSSTRQLWNFSISACTTTSSLWLLKSPLLSPSSGRYVSPGVSTEKHIVTFKTFHPSTSSSTDYFVCAN